MTSVDGLSCLKDYELEENIQRNKRLLDRVGKQLPDGGCKIKAIINVYEEELKRRKTNSRHETLMLHQVKAKVVKQEMDAESVRGPIPTQMASSNFMQRILAQLDDICSHILNLRQHVNDGFNNLELRLKTLEDRLSDA